MKFSRRFVPLAVGVCQATLLSTLLVGRSFAADAEGKDNKLSEPVYRVATETPAAETAKAAAPPAVAPAPAQTALPAAQAASASPAVPFDLTQKSGEHPLQPMIRVMQGLLADFDKNVNDYTCTFQKQERIEGELADPQKITLKVLSRPFSAYLYFNQPYTGREVLYVDGRNNNDLTVLDCGFKRHLGKLSLDPKGTFAMSGQKYPITNIGIHYLMSEIINVSTADTQFGESEVKVDLNSHIGPRAATEIRITHPTPRKNFRAYISRIFLDNELRVPICYIAYTWPEQPGQLPTIKELEETYTYADLKLNTGLTAADFDDKNPNIFKP
jgi:Protein of unknown function (DUF1571)